MNKENTIGFIAGRGEYPFILCQEAKKQGISQLEVVCFHDHINEDLLNLADSIKVVYIGQIKKMATWLKKRGITQVVMSGQLKPKTLFRGMRPDWDMIKLLRSLKEKNAHTIFGAFCNYLASYQIEVLPANTFMQDYIIKQGVLGKISLKKDGEQDMKFAFQIAKNISDLNIGQTCVVKNGSILAVEGFEGTNKAILRGGELGYNKDITVAKVAKKNHDMRFDIPCIGIETINCMIQAGVRTLVIEAEKTLFLQKAKIIRLCNQNNICIVGY